MDRRIEKRTWTPKRLMTAVAALIVLAAFATFLIYLSTPRLHVERDKLLIATVRRGTFQPSSGSPGPPTAALLLDRGAFFQATGGHWVFVLDETGDTAARRPVRLGRQSNEVYEVLSGLAPGERVITSSYDNFGEAEELVLSPPKN
jgi:hypothetical protein